MRIALQDIRCVDALGVVPSRLISGQPLNLLWCPCGQVVVSEVYGSAAGQCWPVRPASTRRWAVLQRWTISHKGCVRTTASLLIRYVTPRRDSLWRWGEPVPPPGGRHANLAWPVPDNYDTPDRLMTDCICWLGIIRFVNCLWGSWIKRSAARYVQNARQLMTFSRPGSLIELNRCCCLTRPCTGFDRIILNQLCRTGLSVSDRHVQMTRGSI